MSSTARRPHDPYDAVYWIGRTRSDVEDRDARGASVPFGTDAVLAQQVTELRSATYTGYMPDPGQTRFGYVRASAGYPGAPVYDIPVYVRCEYRDGGDAT